MQPHPVYDDSRGQGRSFIHDGLSQVQSAAAVFKLAYLAVFYREGIEKTSRHHFAGDIGVAALVERQVACLALLVIQRCAVLALGGVYEQGRFRHAVD